MLGIKKLRRYNSKIYNLSNTYDFEEFYGIIDTLNDFDFATKNMKILYTGDFKKASIHVETKEKMLEIWLVKHLFREG